MFNNPSNNLYTQGIKDKNIQKEINAIFDNMTDKEFERVLIEYCVEETLKVVNKK